MKFVHFSVSAILWLAFSNGVISEDLYQNEKQIVDIVPKGPGRPVIPAITIPIVVPGSEAPATIPAPDSEQTSEPAPQTSTVSPQTAAPTVSENTVDVPEENDSDSQEDMSETEELPSNQEEIPDADAESENVEDVNIPESDEATINPSPTPSASQNLLAESSELTMQEESEESTENVNSDIETDESTLEPVTQSTENHPVGEGYFPCHSSKGKRLMEVTCERVQIPDGLCGRCPLRETSASGQFKRCNDIYDTNSATCKEAMLEYVEANGDCDPVRSSAVPLWISGDSNAQEEIDYFLYSVCELCCDCIPMGSKLTDYNNLLEAHTVLNPTLYDAERGNCPAHAEYDLCMVLPAVRYLTKVDGEIQDLPPACPLLNEWLNSDMSIDWETNPKTVLDVTSKTFLNGALDAISCDSSGTWNKCYVMEDKQNHLALPEENISAENDIQNSDINEESILNPETIPGQENDATGVKDEEEDSSVSDSSNACFPGDALVEIENGGHKRMDELLIGDRIRVSNSTFSDVYMFSHRDEKVQSFEFLEISTNFTTLSLTSGHLISIKRKGELVPSYVMAKEISKFDLVLSSYGEWVPVLSISRIKKNGLYNPHTLHGDIAVNGVIASTFTRSIKSSTAVAFLAPIRAMYASGIFGEATLGEFLTHGVLS